MRRYIIRVSVNAVAHFIRLRIHSTLKNDAVVAMLAGLDLGTRTMDER